jgi:hypothetical protein
MTKNTKSESFLQDFFGIFGELCNKHSGLLQWLLPDFPTENPLHNGMFCYICNGLVLVQRH